VLCDVLKVNPTQKAVIVHNRNAWCCQLLHNWTIHLYRIRLAYCGPMLVMQCVALFSNAFLNSNLILLFPLFTNSFLYITYSESVYLIKTCIWKTYAKFHFCCRTCKVMYGCTHLHNLYWPSVLLELIMYMVGFTVQPLVNYKCENTALNVTHTSNT